jgi:hypothetical protein
MWHTLVEVTNTATDLVRRPFSRFIMSKVRITPPDTSAMKFRFDRSVSLGLAGLMSNRRSQPISGRFPILMYHGVNGTLSRRHPYYETNTSPAAFRRQMQVLAAGGYQSLSLDGALGAPSPCPLAKKPVVITFDDGYADFYDEALPILAEFGFIATVFIITGSTGSSCRGLKCGNCPDMASMSDLIQ